MYTFASFTVAELFEKVWKTPMGLIGVARALGQHRFVESIDQRLELHADLPNHCASRAGDD